jgi:hypothetical protein
MGLGYETLLIALGFIIPVGLAAIGRWVWKKTGKKKQERLEAEKKRLEKEEERDRLLKNLHETMVEVKQELEEQGKDIRCIYKAYLPALDAIETNFMILKGEQINGNVTDALRKIDQVRDEFTRRIMNKVGCADIGEGTD